jgi:endonuclease/exonuclease/phosphatase family metal-dependent hydrolase
LDYRFLCLPNNTRKAYLKNLINEFGLQYENVGNTFTNSKGWECSEIDYFIHNIPQQQIIAEKAIIQIDTNTSDHYPISMSLKWEHNKDDKLMTPNAK